MFIYIFMELFLILKLACTKNIILKSLIINDTQFSKPNKLYSQSIHL